MNLEEQNYLNLLKEILETGYERKDRTGIGTLSLFGKTLKFSLENDTLPLITTKKVFLRGVIEELLFFIRGETNSKKLEERGINIWKGNTSRQFLDQRGLKDYPEGEMGPMYGSKWRNFNGIDQLQNVLDLIKTDPNSRRMIISAYDPSKSKYQVLDECHLLIQFYVQGNDLSLQWYQRSVDSLLGLPFNICSYGLLCHLVAKATGLNAKNLIFVGGDTHLYSNHLEQAREQLLREPFDFPTIKIDKDLLSLKDIEDLSFENFILKDYKYHPAIKAVMAI